MRIIIRAMGTGERMDAIKYLKKELPFAEWCYDRNRNAMETFLRAFRIAGDEPCLHMEEDVILAKNFYYKMCNVIKEHPENIIQFFSMRKDDLRIGSRWDRKFCGNLCHYIPKGYSNMIADYWNTWTRKKEHPTGYDIMIDDWLRERKEHYWIHVPNLVDHIVGKSLIDPRRSSKRVSKTFVL